MAAQKKKPEAVIEDGAVYVLRAGTPIFVKTAGHLCNDGQKQSMDRPIGQPGNA